MLKKAILEFDTTEDEHCFRCAIDGHKWRSVVLDLDQWLRNTIKYGVGEMDQYEQAREALHNLLDDEGLDPWGE